MSKFIDEVPITVIAGHGGPGAVSFRHEKFAEFGGPDGGEGGHGGNVILRSDLNLQTLDKYIPLKHYSAGAGSHGEGKNRSGKKGEDLILKVPVGTQVTDIETEDALFDFVKEDMEYTAAKGGRGGKGNAFFKTSVNQAPEHAARRAWGRVGHQIRAKTYCRRGHYRISKCWEINPHLPHLSSSPKDR